MPNQEHSGPRALQEDLAVWKGRDRLLLWIAGATISLILLSTLLYQIWGSSPVLAIHTWFNPMGFVFITLASISLAFLMRGRYEVFADPFSYWIGLGFATNSVGLAFYVLSWPGLLPDDRSIIARLPSTAGFLVTITPTFLAAFILTALLARWPREQAQTPRPMLKDMLVWCLSFTLLYILVVAFERFLPSMVRSDGTYSIFMLGWNAVNVLLFSLSSVLAIRHYQRSGDLLSAYIVFPQIALIFAIFVTLIGQKRYDLWWYLGRFVLMSGYLVVLFGLLSQYVQLFRKVLDSEYRYRLLTESLPQLIWTCTADGLCNYLSPQWVAYTGIPEAAQLGAGWIERIHPDDIPLFKAAWETALSTGKALNIEFRLRSQDGTDRWFKTLALPIHDSLGQITRWFGSCTDIEDQKQAEEALQTALARAEAGSRMLDAIMQNVPIGLSITGSPPDFPIEKVSQRGLEMNQRAADGLVGVSAGHHQAAWNLYLADGVTRPQTEQMPLYRASRLGEEVQNQEMVMEAQDGRKIPILVNAAPVRDARNKIVAAINIWLDISEHKQAEERMAAYASSLERSNRDLQDFAFVASHDLQEPLRKIEAFGDLLLEKPENLNEQQRDILARMRSSANRMRKMVDGMLQLSRIETQAKPFQPVDLNQILQEVLVDLEMQVRRMEGTVEVCPLPVIEADPLQMRRLFQNLVGNALKFQPRGGKPRVWVCSEPVQNGSVQVMVQDNGIGFDEEHAEHLFEPFKRLVGRSDYEGSGMGLAICRKIVERHNGSIGARSKSGQGTTFVITLPIQQSQSIPTLTRDQNHGG